MTASDSPSEPEAIVAARIHQRAGHSGRAKSRAERCTGRIWTAQRDLRRFDLARIECNFAFSYSGGT